MNALHVDVVTRTRISAKTCYLELLHDVFCPQEKIQIPPGVVVALARYQRVKKKENHSLRRMSPAPPMMWCLQ